MVTSMHTKAVSTLTVILAVTACVSPDFDAKLCSEGYEERDVQSYNGPAIANVSVSGAAVALELEVFGRTPMSFTYPSIRSTKLRDGRLFEGPVTASVDVLERRSIVQLTDDSNRLILRAGEVLGLPQNQAALVAASFAPREGPCSADPERGFFAGAEFRSIDAPLVIAAGEDRDVFINREPYVAAVPWAFVEADENSYFGWAYVIAILN